MPGKEIKGGSKIATYRHGGRAGFQSGKKVFGDPEYHKEAEKRKQAHIKKGKENLQAKYPDFKFKNKGGKV